MKTAYFLAPFASLAPFAIAACASDPPPKTEWRNPIPATFGAEPPSPPHEIAAHDHGDWPAMKHLVVSSKPGPDVNLLASFDEPDATNEADCESALRDHAVMLGANRLYIDRTRGGCHGAAYAMQSRELTISNEPPENYALTLHEWMMSRWKRPASLTDQEALHLCVVTKIWTTETLHIFRVLKVPFRSSGNADFDESVRALFEGAIDEPGATVPEPKGTLVDRAHRSALITIAFSPAIGGCR